MLHVLNTFSFDSIFNKKYPYTKYTFTTRARMFVLDEINNLNSNSSLIIDNMVAVLSNFNKYSLFYTKQLIYPKCFKDPP